jgi:cell volume regulation protein A
VTAGVARSSELFGLVFVLVVAFTLVQGPTLSAVATALRLSAPSEPDDLGVEAAPLEDLHADLLQLRIPPGSRLHGVEIFELRLPRGSAVTLVVRDGVSFVPTSETQLRRGDSLLIVATARTRPEAERRLRAVSRHGRLAAWYGDRGR